MRRKEFIRGVVIFFTFFFLVFLGFFFTENKDVIINSPYIENAEKKAMLEKVYDLKFLIEDTPVKTMDLLLPAYGNCEIEQAENIASLFGNFEFMDETEDFYAFSKEFERVFVYKYISLITYENDTPKAALNEKIDKDDAVSVAWEFLADKMIYFDITDLADINNMEISVLSNENGYSVSFINNIGGYRNYAFPSTVFVDASGNITTASQYYFQYEKIDTCRTKSMSSAFLDLPADFPEYGTDNCRVDLKNCRLVYFYENSIVQPAYMFSGEIINENKVFTCFVKAALYE